MPRLPRFERAPIRDRLEITARDLEILRHLGRHRFLDSRQITRLAGGSMQHVLKRLQRLFHGGYLDRPAAQIRYYSKDGPLPLIYAIGAAGSRLLREGGVDCTRYDNRNIKQLY